MGNAAGNNRRRQNSRREQPQPQQPPPNPPAGYYNHQYPPSGLYPPMPLRAPYDHHHHHHRVPQLDHGRWYPCGPYVRNDVTLKRESVRVEKDDADPGKYLVAFSFAATAPGSITLFFFAKEGDDFQLKPMKESVLPPITFQFEPGLGQKFRQPSGTGIDFSMFEESELLKEGDAEAYPLAIKAETRPPQETDLNGKEDTTAGSTNSQITRAVFEKEKGEYHVKAVKQFLWVNGTRYELQEIYGIGNSIEGETDDNDPGKECVICLSEPRDTIVLPCRHMCMCSGCAKVLRFQTNRCPICRQPVERLLEI